MILEVADFTGGMTDRPVDAAPNKFELAVNCFVSIDSKLRMRPGQVFFTSSPNDTRIPILDANERVGRSFILDDYAFMQSAGSIFYSNGSSQPQELIGPSNSMWPSAAATFNITGDTTSGSRLITNIVSIAGLNRGYEISHGNIPSGTTIQAVNSVTELEMSSAATASGSGLTITITLPRAQQSNFVSNSFWNKHQILVSDSFNRPVKIYKDETDAFRLRTAGLPRMAPNNGLSSPTAASTTLLSFTANTSVGSKTVSNISTLTTNLAIGQVLNGLGVEFGNTIFAIINANTIELNEPAVSTNVGASYNVTSYPFNATITNNKDVALTSGTTDGLSIGQVITGVTPNPALTPPAQVTIKTIVDSTHLTLSAPVNNASLSLRAAGDGGYIYSILYYYEYMIGSELFKDFGPTHLIQVLDAFKVTPTTPISITNIPNLVNSPAENWDTANIKVKIYRTSVNGNTQQLVATLDNGTSSYSDQNSDVSIVNNEIVYTDGGVYDNDPPPPAKYSIVINDIAYYGHVKEGNEVFTSRIRQAIKFDPDSCPESFAIDLEDELTGFGAIQVFPICFCKNHIFRVEGFHDELGRGFLDKREVSRATGCISHNSIVSTLTGVYFAGNDGFYHTDGYRVTRISDEIPETYRKITATEAQRKRIYGFYDEKQQQVLWSCQLDPSSPDNDTIFVLHTRYGVRPDAVFTYWNGGNFFSPTTIFQHNGSVCTTDRRGFVFKFNTDVYDDPKIVVVDDPSGWERRTIIYDYISPHFGLGSAATRKWVGLFSMNIENVTNTSIGVFSNNDDSDIFRPLIEIRSDDIITWGDDTIIWDAPNKTYRWNNPDLIGAKRKFPASGLRCLFKQMRFTNSFTIIDNSDDLGTATSDGTLDTVTLDTFPVNIWTEGSIDYFITFEGDGYEKTYLITDRSDDVLTVQDSGNTLPTGAGLRWQIKGFRKGEFFSLLSYALHYQGLGASQTDFKGDSGGNAGS